MRPVYVILVFDKDRRFRKLPSYALIDKDDKTTEITLYALDSGKSIKKIKEEIIKLRTLILRLNDKNIPIVTNNFRKIFDAFDLPIDMRKYNVYDMHEYDELHTLDEAHKMLRLLKNRDAESYQILLANSAVVYADLEQRGLLYNFTRVNPIWTQDTFSGRSKSSGFNIQGFSESALISTISSGEKDVLIHFDWVCADIRVASILSGDRKLIRSFEKSDPYDYLKDVLNDVRKQQGLTDEFDRDECKLVLLKAINSLDHKSIVFSEAYSRLGDWIRNVSANDSAKTMMGREFFITEEKTRLSMFNGVMQGSVAHAMQRVMRRVWERLGSRLVCDIHDSIVLNASPDKSDINAVVKIVSEIMLEPFEDGNLFPLKVSVGKKWKSYKQYMKIYNFDRLDVL